ncbi:putative DD41D transposase [Trichonephila clavipes]|nr:putative DD41D transposase [Trichonephila clavipes]
MITNFFIPELNNHDVEELWFQQDGATCHTARATIDLLNDTFGDRLISRFGPVNWPPRSCDLTPLDYFLWGYVKSLVYADKPQTFDNLEDNIRRVISDIRPQILEKVIENWTSRLDYIRVITPNCLGCPPVDRDRGNAYPGCRRFKSAEAQRPQVKARCTPVVGLSLEHHTGDSTIKLGEIPEGTVDLYDRGRYYRSQTPQLRHGTGGEENILQSPALVVSAATAHKTFGPTDLTSTYSVCTRRVFGGIGHRTPAFRSGV